MAPITHQDLAAFGADLKDYIRECDENADQRNVERFRGINDRLDKVNGNIARHEQLIGAAAESRAKSDQKIVNLEREVFPLWRAVQAQRVATESHQTVPDDDRPAITRGGVKRVVAMFAGAGAVVEGLHRLAPYVAALFTGAR